MKILINTCYGGYGLSHAAMLRYAELRGLTVYPNLEGIGIYTYWLVPESERVDQSNWLSMSKEEQKASSKLYEEQTLCSRDFRTDPTMIQVVEELGTKADGSFAQLKIVEIPDGVDYLIEEYDGMEHIAEVHRTWA